jgi:uncharacterized protein (DUF433 family)/DNA-binding transcriptional MerR regulator
VTHSNENGREHQLRAPEDGGVFHLRDVSTLLRVTDHQVREQALSLSPQQISGWAQKGLFQIAKEDLFGVRRYIRFLDLVTLRMVTILRSHGVSLGKISSSHDYLQDALSTRRPFVKTLLWVDDVDVAEDVFTEVDNILVTASRFGQVPFSRLLKTRIVNATRMSFNERGDASKWHPARGVLIDPKIRSGAPCIEGTGIATSTIYGLREAGESDQEIAQWYELNINQVQHALRWEELLAT